MASLRLLTDAEHRAQLTASYVTLTRFDVIYRAPLPTLHIDWQRLSLAWKAEVWAWLAHRTTGDLFATMPRRHVAAYADALKYSGNYHGPCCRGATHWVYGALARDARVGAANISFVEDGYFPSTLDIGHAREPPKHDLFLGILRACPPTVYSHRQEFIDL